MPTELSNVAQAQILVAKGNEKCFYCGYLHRANELYIQGTSIGNQHGYIGGILCLKCWLPINSHPKNERTLQMDQKEPNKPGIRNLKLFADSAAGRKDWDYTHTDLVDREIILLSAVTIRTQYGEAYLAEIMLDGEKKSALIGGTVLKEQLSFIMNELPVKTTIRFVKKYYTFS
jgi:hypothetical protein